MQEPKEKTGLLPPSLCELRRDAVVARAPRNDGERLVHERLPSLRVHPRRFRDGSAPPRAACGERVGVRGRFNELSVSIGSGLVIRPLTRIASDDASHRRTQSDLSPRAGRGECAAMWCPIRTPYSRRRSQSNRRCGTTTRCSSGTPRCRRNPMVRRTAASESAASRWRRISRWPSDRRSCRS
jgi:hypothetical protein